MKILKYVLIVLLVLIVLFFGNGLLNSPISYSAKVTVDKPATEAWAVMQDESKLSQWIINLKRIELVSGPANTVGAVSNIYVDENGQEMVMQETITGYEPGELMAMEFTMDFMDMDYRMELTEENGQTTIQSSSTVTGNGLFAKSLIAFMSSSFQTEEEKTLDRLKVLIASNTTDYSTNEPEETMTGSDVE